MPADILPVPVKGNDGRFAARIAAERYATSLPHPDGLGPMPPPRPTPSLATLIGARLRREEREREEYYEGLRFLQENPVPEVRHASY